MCNEHIAPYVEKTFIYKVFALSTKTQNLPKGRCLCFWCSRQESNLHHILRKDESYPLNDGSNEEESISDTT